MDDATLINGLLSKRQELVVLNAELRERMADSSLATVVDQGVRGLDGLLGAMAQANRRLG